MRITRITAWDGSGHSYLLFRTESPVGGADDDGADPPLHRLDTGERLTRADDTGTRLQTLDGRIVLTIDD